ncbi:MAG: GNAT family N-acetyltransferase [Planctomycetales bacterium]|nr:GNAT family N-acetyltransferase [Planctomycetales bacterium]
MNSESENLTGRIATAADFAQLAEMNRQLIRDEGHRNAMSALELEHRMKNWLAGEYQAAIFLLDEATVGYALYKHEQEWTYLRQFFIVPAKRRQGLGSAALNWLIQNHWRSSCRIRLDVLTGNAGAIQFWKSAGFQDYCITMELAMLPSFGQNEQ